MEIFPISIPGSCLFLHSIIPELNLWIYPRQIEIFTIHVNKLLVVNRICLLALDRSLSLLFFLLLFSKLVPHKVKKYVF